MISEEEAQQAVMALGTAMLGVMTASSEEDAEMYKESRELVYADMDTDSLKRIIRWAMRQNIGHFYTLCMIGGQDPKEAWQNMALLVNVALEEGD